MQRILAAHGPVGCVSLELGSHTSSVAFTAAQLDAKGLKLVKVYHLVLLYSHFCKYLGAADLSAAHSRVVA